MVAEFQETLKSVQESSEYTSFIKKHPNYHLAHGFIQLNKEYSQLKEWQIGFYSKQKDNLAMFDTNPIKLLPFEDAFKDGGTINELKNPEKFIPTANAIDTVKKLLKEKHSHEIPNSFLVILQVINKVSVYNITAITAAFSMISTHINAQTGEIVKENKSSVLDLNKAK